MGRKTYNSLDDLIDDLDKDSLVNDQEFDLLEEEDLALLHDPVIAPPPKLKRVYRARKAKPVPPKKKPRRPARKIEKVR